MQFVVPCGGWDDARRPKEGMLLQDIRSISCASRGLRKEIAELCWGNFLLEISPGNFLATLHFLKHRKDELRQPINIFFNLQIGEKLVLELPRTPPPIWKDGERLEEESSYPLEEYDRGAGSEFAYTVGMMGLLDCLRTDIPIRSFNLWISMTIEGAEGLLQEQGQHSMPWITAFRALPIEKAMSFRVSTPDGYDAMRKKRVLALVLSILRPDTIREKAQTKVSGERGISDGIEPWVAEEMKEFDSKKPYWMPCSVS